MGFLRAGPLSLPANTTKRSVARRDTVSRRILIRDQSAGALRNTLKEVLLRGEPLSASAATLRANYLVPVFAASCPSRHRL